MKLIVFLAALFIAPLPLLAADASLTLSPVTGTYEIGSRFQIAVLTNTGGESINAAEGDLSFDPRVLVVENIDVSDSIIESWPTLPVFSNENGRIRFSGWTLRPFSGDRGHLVSITFRALRGDPTELRFDGGALLSVDGGSNVLTLLESGRYTFEPRKTNPIPMTPDTISSDALLEPPRFTEYDAVIDQGERIVARGTAGSNQQVTVHYSDGESERSSQVMSRDDGTFTFVSDTPTVGVYRLWAETITDGVPLSSERIAVTVQRESVAAASAAAAGIDLFSTASLAFLAIFTLGVGVGYALTRFRILT